MSEVRENYYEGMFLFPQSAAADLDGCVSHITSILEHAKAELISMRKWDERRLAYDIKGNKRGIYFLCYFKAETPALTVIDRDCTLSEQLLRSMVLKVEDMTLEQMQAADESQQVKDEANLRDSGEPAAAATAPATPATEPAKAAGADAPASG